MRRISERTTNSHYTLSIFIILIAFIFDTAQSIRFPDRVAQPARDQSDQHHFQTAVFALGSFWRSEAVFGCLPGVVRTTVGYSGGSKPNPEYRSFGDHAESVQVEYDPRLIGFRELLDIFWSSHDPRQVYGQGPDVGNQYRIENCFCQQRTGANQVKKQHCDYSNSATWSISPCRTRAPEI
ncbi:unnamed protein product [Trifolium pratense]|uniref:Uncharacterized protein n=1 Tax=Trifolium pratense TaxID=57577 RepID=A0ACB0IV23_TRIPR|nr:unnamed protein product [Trifolium pratense]